MPFRRFSAASVLVGAALFAAPLAAQDAAQGSAPSAAFTDSTVAGLAGTKRVAITNVVIAFQASTGAEAGAKFFVPLLTAREKVQTVLALPQMDAALQDAVAEAAYRTLAKELAAAGYEVVPREQVLASANYQAILGQGSFANRSQFANAMGDVMLVGAPGLTPYTAYQGEIGNFQYPSTTYLGWIGGFGGKSSTPGGLSIMRQANAWKVPGLEVALAKELNAHVVKAYYVVSLGKAEARRSTSWNSKSGYYNANGDLFGNFGNYMERKITGTGTAFAQAGLVADQSHIAFRTPTGNAKWQKVAMTKVVPPKDGDVVVRLAAPIAGGTEYFELTPTDFKRSGGLMFSAQKRADINLMFEASIIDPAGYGKEVTAMIGAANQSMLALVKQ